MKPSLSVMLVDDHTMLRQGLRRSLEHEGLQVVAEASNGSEAVRLALAHRPDVVLMDVSMPEVDGIEATRQLMRADARQRVVMLTMHVDRDIVERSVKAGAVGYVTKDSSVKEVVLAVRMAADGNKVLSTSPSAPTACCRRARRSSSNTLPTGSPPPRWLRTCASAPRR
jgi:DNA-binding NarL/FixJ family response regulator